jgi:CheY-like chemotaxis protein
MCWASPDTTATTSACRQAETDTCVRDTLIPYGRDDAVEDLEHCPALIRFLNGQRETEMVGQAPGRTAAVREARARQPDVVFMDLKLPVMIRPEATRIIRCELPETEVNAISMRKETHHGAHLADAGAAA